MSSDPMELIANMLRNTESDLNQQILSERGTTNQTIQPNQGALSSDGPNVSSTFQVSNSNVNQRSYNINFIGNFNLGARASSIGDHAAYLNQQESQSTNIKYASQSNIEASKFIGSNSVPNDQPSNLSADQADFNAKFTAVKESTVELGKSTVELKGSNVELAEVTAKLSESVTMFNWPAFKLGVASKPAVNVGDLFFLCCMLTLDLSRSIIQFGRVSVNCGESIVRDSANSMTTVGKSISLVVFDASTLTLGETTAGYRQSCTSYMESLAQFGGTTELSERSHSFEKLIPLLRELIGPVVDLDAIEKIAVELGESVDTFNKSLTAFRESVIAYSKAIAALDDLLAAFNRQNQ